MKNILRFLPAIFALSFLFSCESEKRFPPKGYLPVSPEETEKLEAAYFWASQDKLSSPYWKDASYVSVSLSDVSTKQLYADGYLNMTGTYNGMADFNKGVDPVVTIKAGYDSEFVYFLVEWKDTTADASMATWIWQGPEDDLKPDSATGWTSQKNNDNLTLIIDNPESATNDAWFWSLATTAPFDLAQNLKVDQNGNLSKPVESTIYRNSSDNSSRSGPKHEWNGERQEFELPDGSIRILDPAYYLFDENKMEFKGDVVSGESLFNGKADCKYCHGINGNGIPEGYTGGGPLNGPFTNKYSREGLEEYIGSRGHEGGGSQYWGKIKNNPTEVENILAFMRGIAGQPGQIHIMPENKVISAKTNISVGGIEVRNTEYKVLLSRKLNTENSEDIQFDITKSYNISIRLTDNDEINFVGATGINLLFKSNAL